MTRSAKWLRFIQSLKLRESKQKIIPLRLNSAQQKVWAIVAPKIDAGEPIRLIILKARREGISTLIEALLMTHIASGDLVNALITAHMKKPATKIWEMSKLFVTSSAMLNALAVVENNTISLGSSRLEVATAGTPESERGSDLTDWHSSEGAFYPHPRVMLATMQALPQSNDIFSIGALESTANGKVGEGEMFYDEWCRAQDGDSDWTPVFLAWHEFTEYQLPGIAIEEPTPEECALRERFELSDAYLAWRRWAIRNKTSGSVTKFRQEYPATADEAFVSSGLPFFEPQHLLPLERHIRKGVRGTVSVDGKWEKAAGGYLEVFVLPVPGRQYVVGADSSMGLEDKEESRKEHSRSAACVLDMDSLEQVAEYDAATPPHLMARHLAGIGRMYNDALLAPEVQSSGGGGGREILVYLRDLGYWNIHRWSRNDDKIRRSDPVMLGWETNARTRPRMLARIREVVMEQSVTIHSQRLFKQLSDFGEADSGHMEALAGRDDLLFAFGISLMSRSENYFVMPRQDSPLIQSVDWESMGLRVVKPETPFDRIKRILAMNDDEGRERSFLEY